MQGVVAYAHNPSTRESETGGPLGLTANQAIVAGGRAPGQ